MPSLRGRVVDGQMLIDVWLSKPDTIDSFRPTGQLALRGLVDTGAQVSGISETAARTIGLVPVGSRDMGGAHGTRKNTPIFLAYLALPFVESGDNPIPDFRYTQVKAALVQLDGLSIDVLIGMDVLSRYRLLVENEQFVLSTAEQE